LTVLGIKIIVWAGMPMDHKISAPTVQRDSPIHILKARFTKGEISKEEDIEMKVRS
jgi:uncharacterized membrane protein